MARQQVGRQARLPYPTSRILKRETPLADLPLSLNASEHVPPRNHLEMDRAVIIDEMVRQ